MTTAPLLYVCVRPQREAAEAEYESFRAGARLDVDGIDSHDLVGAPLPGDALERYSGFVVGGSPFSVTDPESTKPDTQLRVERELAELAQATLEGRTASLFTCYGIGIVTRLLGGEVSRAHPEDTGPTVVELTDDGATDPLFGGLAHRFTALTAHKEGAGVAPPGAVLLATNEACPVQAYRVGDNLYATQFHPELTPRALVDRMAVYRDDGYFDTDDYDVVAGRVLAASVTEPPRLLRAFAKRFGPA
ncbi:GMP synthase [Microbacterium sp. NPDC055910]|uniref:glutamine amidotransferase-related protein n=1 Tax=Microbacterium sp. NPDC055910 TaxID=3345659 RepID=UPI0035E356D8